MDRNQVMDVIDLEVNKRLNENRQVHGEDLIHFLIADYRYDEKEAQKYVDLYASMFTEEEEDVDNF